MTVRILVGHVLDVLQTLPDESVQCCITSPPYWGLRDYGLPPVMWDDEPECKHLWGDEVICDKRALDTNSSTLIGPQRADARLSVNGQFCWHCGAWRGALGLEPDINMYVKHLVEIFREVRRVLRSDGTLWLNLGDKYAAGSWGNYGARQGKQRSRIAERWHRPAYEDKSNGWDGLPPTAHVDGLKPKDLCLIPFRVASALQADGWWLRCDIIWHKPNCMPESVKDRPTIAHEYVFLLSKSAQYFYDAEAKKEPMVEYERQRRLREHEQGLDTIYHVATDGQTGLQPQGKRCAVRSARRRGDLAMTGHRNRRSVWSIASHSYREAHFATFPPSLVHPMVLAGTGERGCCPGCGTPWARILETKFNPQSDVSLERGIRGAPGQKRMDNKWNGTPRGSTDSITTDWRPACECIEHEPVACTVLDPFGGAGSTGLVADRLGRDAILIELNPDYAELARRRIQADAPMFANVELIEFGS